MKLIRNLLGKIIIGMDQARPPEVMHRSSEEQAMLNQKTQALSIYEFKACPFCVKVRRELKRLNLEIERRDAKNDATYKAELISNGGKYQVPCLRIENEGSTQWMYESNDIIKYLRANFA